MKNPYYTYDLAMQQLLNLGYPFVKFLLQVIAIKLFQLIEYRWHTVVKKWQKHLNF